MPLTIDRKTYGRLLAKEAPARITNDAEHAAALERTKEILLRENEATPEELAYLDLRATLIEDYERNRWPLKREECSPRAMLAFLMEQNGLKQSDLSDIARNRISQRFSRESARSGQRQQLSLAGGFT